MGGGLEGGRDREVTGDIEQGLAPDCLVLGILGVFLAGIRVKRAQSRGWTGKRRWTPSPGDSSVFVCLLSFEPRARRSRSSISVYYLTEKALV